MKKENIELVKKAIMDEYGHSETVAETYAKLVLKAVPNVVEKTKDLLIEDFERFERMNKWT